jgi:hypothetical protein
MLVALQQYRTISDSSKKSVLMMQQRVTQPAVVLNQSLICRLMFAGPPSNE